MSGGSAMTNVFIQTMQEHHLPDVLNIYNREIREGIATFDKTEQTLEEKTEWFLKNQNQFPQIVAVQGLEVVGFAYLSTFREKEAFSQTAEVTLYVRPDKQGGKIGSKLLETLLIHAQEKRFHTLISVITEGNEHSIHLHKKFDFQFCGELKEVGCKHHRWLNISFYQKKLDTQINDET